MATEYKEKTGESMVANSGYRSFAKQAELKKKYGRRAAAPGKSKHNYGLAVDIQSKQLNKANRLGLLKKHKLSRPVKGEPWHVESAGSRLAKMVQAAPKKDEAISATPQTKENIRKLNDMATRKRDMVASAAPQKAGSNLIQQNNTTIVQEKDMKVFIDDPYLRNNANSFA